MAPTARIDLHAQDPDLGRHLQSWSWTKYHYFPLAAVIVAVTVGILLFFGKMLRHGWGELADDGPLTQIILVGTLVVGLILVVKNVGATWHYLRGALSGIGRGLHLYEHGLVVTGRAGRQSWPFLSLVSLRIEPWWAPRIGSFGVSVTLTDLDGRKLVVDKRKAVAAVVAAARAAAERTR